MSQLFKTIYFHDYPAQSSKKKNLKLAFNDRDVEIYQTISSFSSQEMRELIGYNSFNDLKDAADKEYLPINTFCLRTLREKNLLQAKEESQLYFPNIPLINPIHTTFKGGHSEPLHLWYPFLEGYSPEFVEKIIKDFAPTSKHILDPFGGTGTTPLTASRVGKAAFYCEINPLLQHLIAVKIKALSLKNGSRSNVIKRLEDITKSFIQLLPQMTPDNDLNSSYPQTFGESKFFDDITFVNVLKSRTLIDTIACSDPIAADFLSIAILSSLVPASLLKRAGDLRFKTLQELEKEKINFEENVLKQLKRMIFDIERIENIKLCPILVCENAKNLSSIPPLGIDAVITSPPYLNGTNYFRNTKIELWFLRSLNTTKDLTIFREKTITAGINDVSMRKKGKCVHPDVERVVEELKRKAYDLRIPKMVEDYFTDMSDVFDSFTYHLKRDSVIAIDIGDSVYGGVHVPTHKILIELLKDRGFNLKEEILLRKRLSRSGSRLSQVLLIFSKKTTRKVNKVSKSSFWKNRWDSFKREMPHQQEPFSKRNWGHPLHSLCSYQGKLKPSLAHFLIKIFVPENGVILDPFAGVGTIPFEASLSGHKSYGFDISPAARIISSAKVGRPHPDECKKIIGRLEKYLKDNEVSVDELKEAESISFNKNIKDYYEENTFKEILLARRFFLKQTQTPKSTSECIVAASLLHILHGNRPYALSRRSHGITPFAPSGPFEYKSLIEKLQEKVQRSIEVEYSENFCDGNIFFHDATSWWPQEVNDLDAIITSPPFFDSTRFHLANWLRLWFCGWNLDDFRSKPLMFIDERQKINLSVYESIFRQSKERLKKDGVVVLHLGQSKKCDMANELSKIASRWFKVADLFAESVGHCESHGIRDKGTVTSHQYLVLR